MNDTQEIAFEFICQDMPGALFEQWSVVRLGIQHGKTVIDDVPGDEEGAVFRFTLRVAPNKKTGQPNFLGPYAQGRPEQRFVYLCWGERREDEWEGFRRAKIHLKHLTWDHIERAHQTQTPIRVAISMTDDKGGPLCASVREEKIAWQI